MKDVPVDCPPSSDQVMAVLEDSDTPLDPTQIQERTGLARRTVYIALDCLQKMKAVVKGISLSDTRRRKYALKNNDRRN